MRVRYLLFSALMIVLFLTACSSKEEMAIDLVKKHPAGDMNVEQSVLDMYDTLGNNTLSVLKWEASCEGDFCEVTQIFESFVPFPNSVWSVNLETREVKASNTLASSMCKFDC